MEAKCLALDHPARQRALATARRAFLAASFFTACTPFASERLESAEFLGRAKTQEANGLRISVAALTPDESRRYLGEDLDSKEVQPVWLRIENQNDFPVRYLPLWTDPNYFSPSVVSFMFHRLFSGGHNRSIDEYFAGGARFRRTFGSRCSPN